MIFAASSHKDDTVFAIEVFNRWQQLTATLIDTNVYIFKTTLNMAFCILYQGIAIAVYYLRSLLIKLRQFIQQKLTAVDTNRS